MLKRNGQVCRHVVPEYAGHLTDDELVAYDTVFPSIEKHFNEMVRTAGGIAKVESSLSRLSDCNTINSSSTALKANDGRHWHILKSLFEVSGVELLFCKRDCAEKEFAVIEKWGDPLAHTQGDFHIQSVSDDPQQLLQALIKDFREALKIWADEIENEAQASVNKEFPDRDMYRVVKAISQRCAKAISDEGRAISVAEQKRGVKIKV
jgi:hypothetical protein